MLDLPNGVDGSADMTQLVFDRTGAIQEVLFGCQKRLQWVCGIHRDRAEPLPVQWPLLQKNDEISSVSPLLIGVT